MAAPTLDQRTPNLRLKYESSDTRNYNWEKLDNFAGGTSGIPQPPFDPGTIPPGSIQGSQIAPQAISSDLIFPGESVPGYGLYLPIADQLLAQLNVPLTVATIPALSGNPRKGPTLITGVLPLTFFNTAASVASAAFNVDMLVYGTSYALAHFQGFNIDPGAIMPFTVPLLMMIQAPTGPGGTALVVQVTKTTGADATLQLKTAGSGSVQMSELA